MSSQAQTVQQLVHTTAWEHITVSHPFLEALRSGKLTAAQFNAWLIQDYLFVRGFARLSGSLLATAPEHHLDVLLGGVAAMHDELSWFKEKAQQRGQELHTTGMQPACQAYRSFMDGLHKQPYAVQATAFWAIEAAYHQAWSRALAALPQDSEYTEFARRWGSDSFGKYVEELEKQADEALRMSCASQDVQQGAARAVTEVAALEDGFWSMAMNAQQ